MKLLNNKTFKEVFFSSKWRLWVDEAWTYSLWLRVITIIIWIICYFLIRKIRWWYNDLWNYSATQRIMRYPLAAIEIIITILSIIMGIFVRIKRAHDLWRKWSRLRCLLIPIYNIIVWIDLWFYPWKKEDNEYWKHHDEKLPIIAYIILVIEFIIVLWWNIFWEKISCYYDDKPLIEFSERLNENKDIYEKIDYNFSFFEETKNIVDSKLNCDCFWNEATETTDVTLDENFWYEVYDELKNRLLESANNSINE